MPGFCFSPFAAANNPGFSGDAISSLRIPSPGGRFAGGTHFSEKTCDRIDGIESLNRKKWNRDVTVYTFCEASEKLKLMVVCLVWGRIRPQHD